MRVGRSFLLGAAVFAAGTPASFVATLVLLDFAPEPVVWSAINHPASFLRLPLTFFMLAGAVFAVLTILRVRSGDRNAVRTAPDAAMYFHAVTVVYVTIALATPYFDTLSYEPALYAPFAIALLGAAFAARNTGRSTEGGTDNRQGRAVMLAALAAAMAIGASVAYVTQLLEEETAGCTRAWCSPEATLAFITVIAAGAIAASAMMLSGVSGDDSVARQIHLSVTAFACLTLLIAPLIVFRVLPYYVFVPGLFYGLSATALLLSISPKANPTETSEPVGELPPPPDMPI